MLNQIVVVGRLVREPELKESENKKSFTYITLAVPRSFKNVDGQYDTDFVSFKLWDGIAENVKEYCKKGDLLGLKGRVETWTYEQDGKTNYVTDLIAEKITFLSSNKTETANE